MNAITRAIRISLICVIVVFMCPVAGAQEESTPSASRNEGTDRHVLDGWAMGGSFNLLGMGEDGPIEDTLWGPSLRLTRLNPGGIGCDFGLTYILPTGFERFEGVAADAALTYGFPVTHSTLLLLKGGVVAYIGAGSDYGTGDAAPYPGIAIVQHLAGPFAVRADAAVRFWVAYGGWQTFGARLGLLVKL